MMMPVAHEYESFTTFGLGISNEPIYESITVLVELPRVAFVAKVDVSENGRTFKCLHIKIFYYLN